MSDSPHPVSVSGDVDARFLCVERDWGLGFAVEVDGYGMGGVGGSIGWWSVDGGYAIGFVTGGVGSHERGSLIDDAVRDCLGLAPL